VVSWLFFLAPSQSGHTAFFVGSDVSIFSIIWLWKDFVLCILFAFLGIGFAARIMAEGAATRKARLSLLALWIAECTSQYHRNWSCKKKFKNYTLAGLFFVFCGLIFFPFMSVEEGMKFSILPLRTRTECFRAFWR